MKNILFICLLGLPFYSHAAVYKHVDEEGNVIKYSDEPQKPGDKPMTVPKPALVIDSEEAKPKSTFKPTPNKKPKPETETNKSVLAYVAVTILKPGNEDAIRANGGVFPIELASQPPLDKESGHHYVVVVDGEIHQSSSEAKFNLENMDRGAHSVSVEIHDKDGNVMTRSSSITIYVLRASIAR